jgi:uncharacterized protein YbgA (DUF1722 family)/uncharacterized protein YbbK (DUF523 family)
MNSSKPTIGIGACLIGQPVRYNGEAKRRNQYIESLREHVELRAFCPEMAIGMGVPREPIRLVGTMDSVRLTDSATQAIDYSAPMQAYAGDVLARNPDMAGYVLVKGSPSCGFERVKRYNEAGNVMLNDAVGLFAAELALLEPLLPLEEDGRLNDPVLRENFVSRVFAYHDWKQFCAEPLSHKGLTDFWARYKYLMMSRDINAYKEIGRTLANVGSAPLQDVAQRFITRLMQGLKQVATRKKHSNVLQHIRGYLKRDLRQEDKQEMDALITQYRCGFVPLVVPLTMLKHHFKHHAYSYIDQQVYMQPYPEQLSLRNLI